jgi:hypothetical protein
VARGEGAVMDFLQTVFMLTGALAWIFFAVVVLLIVLGRVEVSKEYTDDK